uniref:Leucine-rich repeat-containing N-terminal plant-type domain-containing protein n=1 Tax=Solanum lycopersicum TaxID=4081 RepID=A0A3Q7HS13_SOLLC
MSNNNLSEEIPSSVCNLRSLKSLGNVSSLEVFDMHLSGTIPTNFCTSTDTFPMWLKRNLFPELRILDVAYNALTETFNRTRYYLGDQYYQDSVTNFCCWYRSGEN